MSAVTVKITNMATLVHQNLVSMLYDVIKDHIKQKNGNCKVIFAPYRVYCNPKINKYSEPDLLVVCDPTKLKNKGCYGPPDFIVEVISESTSDDDYGDKLFEYMNNGVREYWIVDPFQRLTHVYISTEDNPKRATYSFGCKVPVGIFDDELLIEID